MGTSFALSFRGVFPGAIVGRRQAGDGKKLTENATRLTENATWPNATFDRQGVKILRFPETPQHHATFLIFLIR
jgi:hypothetical protein